MTGMCLVMILEEQSSVPDKGRTIVWFSHFASAIPQTDTEIINRLSD